MKKGQIFKAVEQQLAEMDEMNVPDKEWSILDEEFLSTEDVIVILTSSKKYEHRDLGWTLQTICDREESADEE